MSLCDNVDQDNVVEDIDAEDTESVQFVSELVQDIIKYWKQKEITDHPSPNYLSNHNEINEPIRYMLVNWMIDVHMEFQTITETIYLAVSLLDRYLSSITNIPNQQLQLIGVTALFIASKFEETFQESLSQYVYIVDHKYSAKDILEMECALLNQVKWNLSIPSPLHFLRRYSKAARSDSRLHTLCKYLIELSLPEYCMLPYLPSLLAASAVYLARKMASKKPYWNATLVHYTEYVEDDLRPCARSLVYILKREAMRYTKAKNSSENLSPVTMKYSNEKFYKVAESILPKITKLFPTK